MQGSWATFLTVVATLFPTKAKCNGWSGVASSLDVTKKGTNGSRKPGPAVLIFVSCATLLHVCVVQSYILIYVIRSSFLVLCLCALSFPTCSLQPCGLQSCHFSFVHAPQFPNPFGNVQYHFRIFGLIILGKSFSRRFFLNFKLSCTVLTANLFFRSHVLDVYS
jgi:hypothetical protein